MIEPIAIPQSMQAAVYDRYGGPEVVSLRQIAVPNPLPGELLIHVEASSLNPKDVLIRKGKFRWLSGAAFPKGIGFDVVGRVVRAGAERDLTLLGRRVIGFHHGFSAQQPAVADYTTLRSDRVAQSRITCPPSSRRCFRSRGRRRCRPYATMADWLPVSAC